MNKVIFLFDLNSFFANAEIARNPELKGKEVLIGPRNNHSIIIAATPNAKAKGIHVGMPYFKAKDISPDAVYINPDHAYYSNLSNRIFNFLKIRYTDLIEVSSIDEAYMDVTEILIREPITEKELAQGILKDIKKHFNVTASIGISYNKFLAKMASEFYKVDSYSTCYPSEVSTKLWSIDIEKMYGVGNALAPYLKSVGINKIGDLARSTNDKELTRELKNHLMSYYETLINWSNGISTNELDLTYEEAKSISKQITLNRFLNSESELSELIKELSIIVGNKLKKSNLAGKNVDLLIRFGKFDSAHKSITLKTYINDESDIYDEAMNLLEEIWNFSKPVKGARITVSSIKNFKKTLRQGNILDADRVEVDSQKELLMELNNKLGFEGVMSSKDYENNPKYEKDNAFKSNKVKFKSWD
ncbi:MAG: DNA polymerase IV [Mycoplasmataceae bacterium]|nr:DNA polymerase IV [Mycoplasmataceae bacterium]